MLYSGVYRCIAELPYYPVALRFNVVVEPSRKERDFAPWSQWRYALCIHE